MKFTYMTKVRLRVGDIKPEELVSVINAASNYDGYVSDTAVVYPEYNHDYEGNPIRKKGTYTFEFETQWYDQRIKNGVNEQIELLKEIETTLTE